MTRFLHLSVDHFTVGYIVAWPSNESETGVDLILIETSLHFMSIPTNERENSIININAAGVLLKKFSSSLTFIQRPGNYAHNCEMVY